MSDLRLPIQATLHPGEPVMRAGRAEPCILVLFGATGDLAKRKLLPALFNLHKVGKLPHKFALVGVSRSRFDPPTFRKEARAAIDQFSRSKPADEAEWDAFARTLDCAWGAYDDPAMFESLRGKLAELARTAGTGGNALFYLATPPSSFSSILTGLAGAGLLPRRTAGKDRPWARLVVEKPFGRDLESAKSLNRALGEVLDESQIFRIDHYLGKETVQNIPVFRFGNPIFEPLWNRQHIDHVEITAAEELGVGGRGGFYDETGVIRDVVQNHLLQVMALCAMEPPISFGAEDIRDEKNKVFRALRRMSEKEVAEHVVQAQYEGYRNEKGVAKDSRTPTFVAMRMFVDTWRWEGVPFYLRAGKQLKRRLTEVSVHFRAVPFCLFGDSQVCQRLEPNVLTFHLQPREGVALRFESKVPGDDINLAGVKMDFDYAEAFKQQAPEAYERLYLDCMRGNATLFARRDSVEEAWAYITPINQALEAAEVPLRSYAPGSAGPSEAAALVARDGRRWTDL
jgi:glucose-6-phosphate 1-dehydrogenase